MGHDRELLDRKIWLSCTCYSSFYSFSLVKCQIDYLKCTLWVSESHGGGESIEMTKAWAAQECDCCKTRAWRTWNVLNTRSLFKLVRRFLCPNLIIWPPKNMASLRYQVATISKMDAFKFVVKTLNLLSYYFTRVIAVVGYRSNRNFACISCIWHIALRFILFYWFPNLASVTCLHISCLY